MYLTGCLVLHVHLGELGNTVHLAFLVGGDSVEEIVPRPKAAFKLPHR